MAEEKAKKDLEYKVNYIEFKPRNYGVSITGARGNEARANKPFIDPASFFFARWFLNSPNQKKTMIEAWKKEVLKSPEERGYEPVFKFEDEALLDLGDAYKDGTPKRTWVELSKITPEQILENSRNRVFKRYGSYNFFDLSPEDVFFLNDEKNKALRPIIKDGDWISGSLKRKSGGSQVRAFDTVSIAGPFEKSRIPLGRIVSNTEDSLFAAMKQGYSPLEYIDTASAALLYLAWRSPASIRGMKALQKRWAGAKNVWIPFNPHEIQDLPEGLWNVKKGVQPPLDALVVDSRLDMEFNNASKFDVSKKLARIAPIYSTMLWSLIYDGLAGFEVLPAKYAVGRSQPMHPSLRKWHLEYTNYLKRTGFSEAGNTLEKKDSAYEAVCQRFVKKDIKGSIIEERRIIFSKKYPPLVVKRSPRQNSQPDIFKEENSRKRYEHLNPYEELFMPKQMYDDFSRKMTNYEVVIPTEVFIPNDMMADYALAVNAFTPGGASQMIRNAARGNRTSYLSKLKLIAVQGKK